MYCDDINLITLYLTYRYVSHGWDFSDFVLCDYGDFSVFQRKESDDGMIKINYFDER